MKELMGKIHNTEASLPKKPVIETIRNNWNKICSRIKHTV